jgi:hypothetical protein
MYTGVIKMQRLLGLPRYAYAQAVPTPEAAWGFISTTLSDVKIFFYLVTDKSMFRPNMKYLNFLASTSVNRV